jgi:hypothetical protein
LEVKVPRGDKPLIIPAAEFGHDNISLRAPIVGWRIDKDAMLAYPQLADGSEGPAFDLVPMVERFNRANRP